MLLLIDLLHFKLTEPKVIKILSQPDNLGCLATFSGQCEILKWPGDARFPPICAGESQAENPIGSVLVNKKS